MKDADPAYMICLDEISDFTPLGAIHGPVVLLRSWTKNAATAGSDLIRESAVMDIAKLIRLDSTIYLNTSCANPRYGTYPANQGILAIRFQQFPLEPCFLLRAHH